jgi:alpha-D-ribose 1-methylphosphonate 5-triphosphate synthase subunit PhnH
MTALAPAFTDPVTEAQACFRAVLSAMARPGSLQHAGLGSPPPAPLDPATAAVLLTLVDADTPVWLDADCAAARPWLAFHCGAPQATSLESATFAVARALPDLTRLPAGTHDDPQASATILLQVAALGAGRRFLLDGPGLAGPHLLAVRGLPEDFAARWAANHALYPRGVDLILCAGDRLAALPRSVRVEQG